MRAVVRLVVMRLRPGRSSGLVLIGLVMTLASAGLAAAISVSGSTAHVVDRAFAATGGPDVVAYVAPSRVSDLSEALKEDHAVATVGPPVESLGAQLLDGNVRLDASVLQLPAGAWPAVSPPLLHAGRIARRSDEIVLDAALADARGVAIGDRVQLRHGATEVGFTVVGTALDFTDCFFPACEPARHWVTPGGFAALGPSRDTTAMVAIRLRDRASAGGVVARLERALGSALRGSGTWPDTRGDLLRANEVFAAFLGVFGIFVLVCSVVVLAAAVTARTAARRRSIGLLKAVGCSGGQIGTAVLVEHLLVALAAVVAGWLAAGLLAPRLRIGPVRLLQTAGPTFPLAGLLLAATAVMTVVLLATLVPARRAGRIAPVAALRDDAAASGRAVRLADWAAAAGAPLPVELGVRHALARPLRSAMAVLALVIALVALTVSLGMNRSVERVVAHPALAGDPWDAVVEPAPGTGAADVVSRLNATREVDHWFPMVDDRARWQGEAFHLRAIGGDPAAARFVIGAGRRLEGPGEAVAGFGLLQRFGWHVGDRLELAVGDHSTSVRLVGWYRETEDSGQILQIRMEDYLATRPGAVASYAVTAARGASVEGLGARLEASFGASAKVSLNQPDPSGVRPFELALLLLSGLVLLVAVTHVFATAVVSARERARALGVLRTVGLTDRQLLGEAVSGWALIGAVAVALAIPIGLLAEDAVGNLLTSRLGAGPGLTVHPSAAALAAAGIAVVVSAAAVGVLAARRTMGQSVADLVRAD